TCPTASWVRIRFIGLLLPVPHPHVTYMILYLPLSRKATKKEAQEAKKKGSRKGSKKAMLPKNVRLKMPTIIFIMPP
ncbi:hypothetical protein, partial [uncultured Helicobacter sp.]|uniref:hypothetical protein n=1 Tax=uncultured Helicobacter sp. TaxID=175537 RepID=UPI0025F41BC0